METETFLNYYEILDLRSNANSEAIERKFRYLASRYHPDNQSTGDRYKFDLVVEAHDTLKDTVKRGQYHARHADRLPPLSVLDDENLESNSETSPNNTYDDTQAGGDQIIDSLGIDRDVSIQNNLLIILYLKRRRNIRDPGIGHADLERLSGCTPEHLEFHIWYLKEKGWVATGDDGLMAITIEGVDQAATIYQAEGGRKLITDQS